MWQQKHAGTECLQPSYCQHAMPVANAGCRCTACKLLAWHCQVQQSLRPHSAGPHLLSGHVLYSRIDRSHIMLQRVALTTTHCPQLCGSRQVPLFVYEHTLRQTHPVSDHSCKGWCPTATPTRAFQPHILSCHNVTVIICHLQT